MEASIAADSAATVALLAAHLLLDGRRGEASRQHSAAAVDQLATIFAHAARHGRGQDYVDDQLSSKYPRPVVDAVVQVFNEHRGSLASCALVLADESSVLQGVSWELWHSLGDRVTVPDAPTRSLPVVRLAFAMQNENLGMSLTAEQLHEFSTELKAAVSAIERVARQ